MANTEQRYPGFSQNLATFVNICMGRGLEISIRVKAGVVVISDVTMKGVARLEANKKVSFRDIEEWAHPISCAASICDEIEEELRHF
jgi:hypothetical protein